MEMTEGSFVPLPGSERETISDVQDIGPVDPGERIEVTLIIRRRAELPADLVIGPATISTEELASTYGADPADIDRVREVLAGYGLEVTSTHPGRTALDQALSDAAALGITVTVAAGDNGSGDGVTDGKNHCDYPASSPYALACGGTRLEADASTGAISSETVWNDGSSGGATGGGVSDVYSLPSWQASAGVPAASVTGGRGVPDVAGDADPQTGYQVLVDGKQGVYGGTSAVAPLWAGLIARLAQATGRKFGLLQPLLYSGVAPGTGVPGFNDITVGSNGAYSAGPGWDACTGLGSPSGTALLARLKG